MAVTRPSTLRWGPIVDAELKRAGVPLPIDLVLAVIDVESQGHVGLVNPKSGASGLMQVMPGTLQGYNEHNPPISLSVLRSKSQSSAPAQIRVGLWVLYTYWRSAFKYLSGRWTNVPVDELARVADLFYVAGPGATKKRLKKLASPTWSSIQVHFPKWNALPHPRNVFKRLEGLQWPLPEISTWLDSKQSIFTPSPKDGLILAVAGVLTAWWFLRAKGKKKSDKSKK